MAAIASGLDSLGASRGRESKRGREGEKRGVEEKGKRGKESERETDRGAERASKRHYQREPSESVAGAPLSRSVSGRVKSHTT